MLMMMRADKGYTPNEKCSLEEMVACALADDTDACLAKCTGGVEPEEPNAGDGFVTVKKGTIPETQYVAINAVEKSIGTIKLTAGDHDTIVSTIEITKSGLGSDDGVDTIQLLSTEGVHVSKPGKLKNSAATVRFTSPIEIKAGKTETFNVVVNMKDNGKPNGVYDFSVTALGVANGKYEGTPVKLGQLITTNYKIKDLTVALNIESAGLDAGETNKKFAKLTLTNSNSTAANIDSVLITLDSVIDSNGNTVKNPDLSDYLSNVKAYVDNKEVGKTEVVNNYIQISKLNLDVASSRNVKIELRGDSVYAGDDAQLKLIVDSNNVVAVDSSTNERMASNDFTPTNTLKVKGVKLEVKNARKGDSTQKISTNDDEVTLLDLTVEASDVADVTKYTVEFDSTFDFNAFTKSEGNSGEVFLWINGVKYNVVKTGSTNDDFILSGDKIVVDTINKKVNGVSNKDAEDYDFQISQSNPAVIKVTANVNPDYVGTFTDSRITFSVDAVEINDDDVDTTTLSKAKKAGHYTKLVSASTKLAAGTDVVSSNTLETNKEHKVLSFNLTAAAADQTLSGLTVTFTGSTGLQNIADSVTLYVGEDDYVMRDSDDLSGTNKLSIQAKNESFELPLGEKVNCYVSVKLKNDASIIGETGAFGVLKAEVDIRDNNDTLVDVKGDNVLGTTYTLANKVPSGSFDLLTDNDSYILLTLSNDSDYDILLTGNMVLSITQKEGTNVSWDHGVATLLDRNGLDLGIDTGSIPSTSLTFDVGGKNLVIPSEDTLVLRVKLDANRLAKSDVKALLQELNYGYKDEDGNNPDKFLKTTW